MLRINKLIVASILIFSQFSLLAQNNTNSPYTRFGYGELADRSFGAGRAMGGVGFGLRSSEQINPMNPASYTSIDSMTFIFDFGASGQVNWYKDGANKQRNLNGNLEYIALQFPVTKWLAVSVGLLPYSYVGYNYQNYIEGAEPYTESFVGTGGLNDLYGGVSIDIWKKRLSVGANVGYLFGNITHEQAAIFHTSGSLNVRQVKKIDVRDLKTDFGLQYVHPLSRTKNITVGAVFSPGHKVNTESLWTEVIYTSSGTGSVLDGDTTRNQAFDIPNTFGIGVSYTQRDKLILAADFMYEDWSNSRFFDDKGDFKNRIRVGGGMEYQPNFISRSLFQRARYRAGLHYSNSYLKVNNVDLNDYGKSFNEYGASVGIGLPLWDGRSLINISFEYTKVKPDAKWQIDEQYFRFTVNYTFNERWFFKFKVN